MKLRGRAELTPRHDSGTAGLAGVALRLPGDREPRGRSVAIAYVVDLISDNLNLKMFTDIS